MADAGMVAKYGNTFDIPSNKWVMEMTDSELIDRGYKPKPEEPEEPETKTQAASKTVKKTVSK